MDKDLEELKVKAQQMLKKCREGDLSVENLPDVRKSLNNLLNDIKSHKLLEDVEFMKIAKELGNAVVNFINTDLAELQKSADEKISAAVDERELQAHEQHRHAYQDGPSPRIEFLLHVRPPCETKR